MCKGHLEISIHQLEKFQFFLFVSVVYLHRSHHRKGLVSLAFPMAPKKKRKKENIFGTRKLLALGELI